MKLRYFSYITERAFQTSPGGERLFLYAGQFWAKPYVIPDEETEKRLFKKQLWMWRILFGALILCELFLLKAMPSIMYVPLWFVITLVAVLALFYLVNWLIFRKELQVLKRSSTRIPSLNYLNDLAKRTSWLGFLLGLLFYIGFIGAGSWIIRKQISPFIGWFSVIFFGLCAIVWGYTLYLKLSMSRDESVDANKTEA